MTRIKKKHSIGLMQGRLTPQRNKPIQFFPFGHWREEFEQAALLGLDEIEWIFDFEDFDQNPLWSKRGQSEIQSTTKKTGIKINTICADYFMVRPFFRTDDDLATGLAVLKKLIVSAQNIGASTIEIPFLDNSSIKNPSEEGRIKKAVKMVLPFAREMSINLNFETDISARKLRTFISDFPLDVVHITYDSGNSSSLGYDTTEEISFYGDRITNIHIKDKDVGGSTVPLGTGNTNFDRLFEDLNKVKYKDSFILQAARGPDEYEKETVASQINFLKRYINHIK